MNVPTRPVLVIEHESDAGLDLMSGPFGSRVRVLRPHLGDRLPQPSAEDGQGHTGLIVLGGEMGAWDDEIAPWLPATRRLLADAVRQQVPTLGICLGAQLLAAACGGTVERGAAGLELGLTPVTPLPACIADPFFGRVDRALEADRRRGKQESWAVHQYHYDAVTRLPADAELLVTGQRYPQQGFRVGSTAWGVQYHPEVSTRGFVRWVDSARLTGELAQDAGARVLPPIRAAEAVQRRLASAHARAFLDVMMTTSTRDRG
jgi:GMP synthase (glutamine-hydrolysing)